MFHISDPHSHHMKSIDAPVASAFNSQICATNSYKAWFSAYHRHDHRTNFDSEQRCLRVWVPFNQVKRPISRRNQFRKCGKNAMYLNGNASLTSGTKSEKQVWNVRILFRCLENPCFLQGQISKEFVSKLAVYGFLMSIWRTTVYCRGM